MLRGVGALRGGLAGALRRGGVVSGPGARRLPLRGLEEFVDTVTPKGEDPVAGRAWTVTELRQKSFDDLHRLWWVLYKEKNLLLTERLWARRKGSNDIRAPDRAKKVNDSMRAIRHVVEEREKRRSDIAAAKEAAAAKEKFDAVRAKALAEGRAPKNAPDAVAARRAAKTAAATASSGDASGGGASSSA